MTETATWLECPFCEYRFSVPPEFLDKKGKCPKCENVFHAGECQIPEKQIPHGENEPPVQPPAILASAISESGISTVPPQSPPVEVAGPKVSIQPNSDESEQSFVTADKPVTDPNKVLLWVSLCCVLAIGLLIGIPAIAMMAKSSDQGGNSDEVVQAESTESNGRTKDSGLKAKTRKSGDGKKQKQKKRNPKSSKKVEPFTEVELQELWGKCYSGIVLVVAKYGSENRTSHGVVISQDGKIAVSLSGIKDADTVRIKFANQDYEAEEKWSKPVNVTTVFNSRPELNVAIIEVQRETIPVNGRSIPVDKYERGVVPVSNAKNDSKFLRLTKFQPAKPFSDLNPSEQQALVGLSMNPESNDYFVIHSAKLSSRSLGTPVFDEQGRFVGMHLTHDPTTKKSFLIPPAALRKILNDPLAKSFTIGKEKTTAQKPTLDSNSIDLPDTFETALESVKNRKWNLQSNEDYLMARNFAWQWWRLNLEYPEADFTRQRKIEKLKEEMASDFNQNLFWPDKLKTKEINEASIQSFREKEKGWMGLVQVLKPAGLAMPVNDEPAILVQLVETDEKALLLPGDVEGPFLQGSQWIVFGLNADSTRLNTADGKCLVIHLAGAHKK